MSLKRMITFVNQWVYYFKVKFTKQVIGDIHIVTRELSFDKESNGCWYVNLDGEWKGPHGALLMVAGADLVLDRLAHGKNYVTIDVTNDFEVYSKWKLKQTTYSCNATSDNGNYYCVELDMYLWLCSVCLFVFNGRYPENIYFTLKST